MATPIILIDSTSGSDTAASGAGPATALTGAAASFAASVVTLNGSPNLTGVATDGSHVLYLATTTGVRFFAITASANSGTPTAQVTVASAPAGTASGLTWAIGGRRASLNSASSALLFDNAGASGDALPGWIVEFQSAHAETMTDRINMRRAGDTTSGPIVLRGKPGAATQPILTWNTNDIAVFMLNNYQQVYGFEQRNTNATKTASEAFRTGGSASDGIVIRQILCDHATNHFFIGVKIAAVVTVIDRCTFGNLNGNVILAATGGAMSLSMTDCYFHDIGADALDFATTDTLVQGVIRGNIFDTITGNGALIKPANSNNVRMLVQENTFYNISGDAVKLTGTNPGFEGTIIESNIFDTITGTAINVPSLSALALRAMGFLQRNNNFHTVGAKYVPSDLDTEEEQTLDPQFVDAPNGNFAIGTNLEDLASPTTAIGT